MAIRSLRPGEPIPDGTPRRFKNKAGYVRLRWQVGERSYIEAFEHRVIAGNPAGFEVHHRNGVKDDNRRENLETIKKSVHARHHHPIGWDVDEAARLYAEGWSLPRLAARYGKNTGNINRALRNRDIAMRGIGESRRTRVDEQALRAMHAAGQRAPHIADWLGVPVTAVRRVIRELNLPPLPTGRPRTVKR